MKRIPGVHRGDRAPHPAFPRLLDLSRLVVLLLLLQRQPSDEFRKTGPREGGDERERAPAWISMRPRNDAHLQPE